MSYTSSSPHSEDPDGHRDRSRRKKKGKDKKEKGKRCDHHEREAKAVATSKITVNLPEFSGKDLSEFAESFARFLRLTRQTKASGRVKCHLLLQCCKNKYIEKQVKQVVTMSKTFADVLVGLERLYPTYETDLSIRSEIANPATLPANPKASRITELLGDLDHWVGRLTPGSYGSDELLFWLVSKLPKEVWDDCRLTAERKARTLTYEDLSVLLLELALERESDHHLNAYRPGGSGAGGRGAQGYHRPGQQQRNARYMKGHLFWCDATDSSGAPTHSPDCPQHNCLIVKGKKQQSNTGTKEKMPDHFRCTVTCSFCGRRKHYEDECYHKKRLSERLKKEVDGGKGGGQAPYPKKDDKKDDKNSGKGKGKGKGKGQDKNKGQGDGGSKGGRGPTNTPPTPTTPTPGGSATPSTPSNEPSDVTTRSQAQKRGAEDADQPMSTGKRTRLLRMVRTLKKAGVELTLPAEF